MARNGKRSNNHDANGTSSPNGTHHHADEDLNSVPDNAIPPKWFVRLLLDTAKSDSERRLIRKKVSE